jgi:hypothetical protein
MKLNELIEDFIIYTTNEEQQVLSKIDDMMSIDIFTDREQVIIENLVRKSLVSKVQQENGSTLVMANEL